LGTSSFRITSIEILQFLLREGGASMALKPDEPRTRAKAN
jgi:hypothetical protein